MIERVKIFVEMDSANKKKYWSISNREGKKYCIQLVQLQKYRKKSTLESNFAVNLDSATLLTVAQIIAAFVTAIATLALWRVTKVLASETKTLADNSKHVFVVSTLKSSRSSANAMNVELKNTGNAAAFDVKVCISPGLPEPNQLSTGPILPSMFEVSMIPPTQTVIPASFLSHEIYSFKYLIECSWAKAPGAQYREHIAYQYSAKDGFKAGWREKGMHQISDNLERIEKALLQKNQ